MPAGPTNASALTAPGRARPLDARLRTTSACRARRSLFALTALGGSGGISFERIGPDEAEIVVDDAVHAREVASLLLEHVAHAAR